MAVAGIVLLWRPSVLFSLLRKYQDSPQLYGLAVLARVTLGIALLMAAPQSKFPLTLEIIGWLAIGAAVFIGAMGRARFSKLMTWAVGLPTSLGHVSGLFAIFFGGFLIYATQ